MSFEKISQQQWQEEFLPGFTLPKGEPGCATQCLMCIKYYETKTKDGTFWPSCNLTFDYQIHSAVQEGRFEETEEVDIIKLLREVDPVAWAEYHLGFKARWYQKMVMRCSANRKAVRMGRRTGKTAVLGVTALNVALTRRGDPNQDKKYNVLIITPVETQGDRIWDDIMSFVESNPELAARVTRKVKDPVKVIEFDNNSKITFMVANENVRGQDASAIFIDEADYCDESVIAAIYPIVMTHPNVLLWASSTPTGFKSSFWEYCKKKEMGFKEYHFKSRVLDHYGPALEYEFRLKFTDFEYDHEVNAEFGEAEAGVFKKTHVANCFDRFVYSYKDCTFKNPNGYFRVMGVDWNEQAGVHIVICTWDPTVSALKLEHRSIIKHSEYTMSFGVQRIIQLQSAWNCDKIYVDSGAGKMEVETLRLYGEKHPETGLRKKVKEVRFGGSIDVRMPGSHEYVKKSVKPLAVNLAVRLTESGKVILPQEERPDTTYEDGGYRHTTLGNQMEEYKIIRVTQNGVPVFSNDNEHTLIAWICAVFGYYAEQTDVLDKKSFNDGFDMRSVFMTADIEQASARSDAIQQVEKEVKSFKSGPSRDRMLDFASKDIVKQARDGNGNLPKNRPVRRGSMIRPNLRGYTRTNI